MLVVSGGLEAIPGIRRAKEMGLHVVVSDANPKAPGLSLADDALIASTYDVAATVDAARRYHRGKRALDGVMCIAADVPLTVASVAAELGLPGIPVGSAQLASDKLAMKDRFSGDGVPVPWYRAVTSWAALRDIVRERGFGLVLKPVDSRGARGVLRLAPDTDLDWAYNFAAAESPTGRVMVEQFLAGPQVSTESFIVEGDAYTPGFSDRNYEYLERFAPHIIENGGDLPGHLGEAARAAVHALVSDAARSMGIHTGTVKGDIVVHDGRPYVIELAARLSGGYFCSHEIPLNTGVDFVGNAIRLALGEKPARADLMPRFNRPVCQRYLFPSPGRVTAIEGVDDARAIPGIEMCEIRVAVGDVVGPTHSHPARAGVIIATGDTAQMARERAVTAVNMIHIRTELV